MILQVAAVAAAGRPARLPVARRPGAFHRCSGELLEDFLVVAAHAEFLLLAHHHEIALAGGRVHRAAAQSADSSNSSRSQAVFTGTIPASPDRSPTSASAPCRPAQRHGGNDRPPNALPVNVRRLHHRFGIERPETFGLDPQTSGPIHLSQMPPRLRSTSSTRPRTTAKPLCASRSSESTGGNASIHPD